MPAISRIAPLAGRALVHAVQSRTRRRYSRVYYVVEGSDWSTKWDGHYISKAARDKAGIDCVTTEVQRGIANQVVHFGSRNLFITGASSPRIVRTHPGNRVAFTWFHGDPESEDPEERRFKDLLPAAVDRADLIVTSANITADRLRKAGVPEDMIVTIPLGVDLHAFRPARPDTRSAIRRELGIPGDAICIGSFQKDGIGWGEGTEPKLIKGPDILVDTVARLAESCPVHVLLTGPARGYVTDCLKSHGIPFTHRYLTDFLEIPRYYQALDLYIVSSRDEGGPKAILESMASGVPLVSTAVGMAPEVITDGENGSLVPIDNVDALSEAASRLIEDANLREGFATAGRTTAERYSWDEIGVRYAEQVYSPLLTRE